MSDSEEGSGLVSPEATTTPKRDGWVTVTKEVTPASRAHSSTQK